MSTHITTGLPDILRGEFFDAEAYQEVGKNPGSIIRTSMPKGFISSASASENDSRAALEAQYAPKPARESKAPTDDRFSICPDFFERKKGISDCISEIGPKTLVWNWVRISASLWSSSTNQVRTEYHVHVRDFFDNQVSTIASVVNEDVDVTVNCPSITSSLAELRI
jgi:hypothetical protein